MDYAEVTTFYTYPEQTPNWIDAYLVHRSPVALIDCDGRGRRTSWTEELEALLRESLSRAPDHWSLAAVNWTVPLLREHLGHYGNVWLSESNIRRKLHQLGYVWKRPRYVLQPDPEREKKTKNSLNNQCIGVARCRVG